MTERPAGWGTWDDEGELQPVAADSTGRALTSKIGRSTFTGEQLLERRKRAEELRMRGLPYQEIADIIAHETGKPVNVPMISNDLAANRKHFYENYTEFVQDIRIKQALRLNTLYDIAFEEKDVRACLSVIDVEAKLFGTYAPKKAELEVGVKPSDAAIGKLADLMKERRNTKTDTDSLPAEIEADAELIEDEGVYDE